MESQLHVLQMLLLIQCLTHHWAKRQDFFVGGNMFVYFSQKQLLDEDFRGPDVFVALDVPRRLRKSWIIWQEGKGPDVVIELMSESTRRFDQTEKKRIYQDELRVPEYFWFDPETAELAGFALRDGLYEPLVADASGTIPSRATGLALRVWTGAVEGIDASWLRWATSAGIVLPTPAETAESERKAAEAERRRAAEAEARADAERGAAEAERQRADRLAEKLRAAGIDPDA